MAHGIAYVSEDRLGQSVIEDFSILDNATLPVITKATKCGMVRRRLELALVSTSLERMKLRFARFDQPIGTLSGGNQQKVVLAKWLATNPRLLILDEPTQGIDIQAKAEVHGIVSELAEQGLAILLISSDMPELIGACDRIMVMRHGEIVAEFDRENASQYEIGLAATGVTAPTADEPDLDHTEPVGRSARALEHLVEPGEQTATVSPKPSAAPAKSAERASPPTEPPPRPDRSGNG